MMSITNTIIKTIVYHLAFHSSAITESPLNVFNNHHELSFPSTRILFDRLLHDPLHSTSISRISRSVLVVLDALDECGSIFGQEELSDLLKDDIPTLHPNFVQQLRSLSKCCTIQMAEGKVLDVDWGSLPSYIDFARRSKSASRTFWTDRSRGR